MKLSEYIKLERGRGKTLAERLGISQSLLSQIAADSSSTAPARCVSIERFTGGAVTRRDLRPDWMEIWPELIEPIAPEEDSLTTNRADLSLVDRRERDVPIDFPDRRRPAGDDQRKVA